MTLRCKVQFKDAGDVWTFWFFNGRLMKTTPLIKARSNKALKNTIKEYIMTLELKHARLAQNGTYTCGANFTAILSVQNISVSVRDVRGPELEQSDSTVQITNGKNETITCNSVYPEASYVDTFWLFNGSRKQTNSKYAVNESFDGGEGTIKRKKISLTIHNAGLKDSGQYSCVLNTSHGLRLKNFSVRVVPDGNGKFLHLLYLSKETPFLQYSEPSISRVYCRFSHDVTKIHTTKLLILLIFYFDEV